MTSIKRPLGIDEIRRWVESRKTIEAQWPNQERTCPGLDEKDAEATQVAVDLLAALDQVPSRMDEVTSDSSLSETYHALARIDRDLRIVTQGLSQRIVDKAPAENTGLPCPYCQEKLPRMDVKRLLLNGEEVLDVRMSTRASQKDLKDILLLLKSFLRKA